MKLFIYSPKGKGESSFSVLAENEKQAFELIDNYIKSKYQKSDFEISGWGTDYYELETKEVGQVVEQYNS